MSAGRERGTALGLCVLGAALMLLAGSQVWFRGSSSVNGLPAVPIRLTGRDVAGVVSAVGLLALAAAALTLLVGTLGRRIVGGVLTVAAVAAIVRVLNVAAFDTDGAVTRSLDATVGGTTVSTTTTASAWPWVALAGAVLVTLGGILILVRAGRWPARSRRYEAAGDAESSGPEPTSAAASSDEMWKALDRGEDPTERSDPPA